MSTSSLRPKRKGKDITKKMLIDKLNDIAAFATALETVVTEYDLWYSIVKNQHQNLTHEEFVSVVQDGPIFSDLSQKILTSIREHLPDMTPRPVTEKNTPALFDGRGNIVEKTPEGTKIQLPK
jgi:hypothetical protein